MMKTNHITVLLHEAVKELNVQLNHWYIDATFGGGGHTAEIIKRGGKVISFDFDKKAILAGQERFKEEITDNKLILINENFTNLSQEITKLRKNNLIDEISGLIYDFGTSTDQLMNEERGFSFSGEGELDMRMDQNLGVKAKDLLMLLSQKQLTDIFLEYGGETQAKQIAKKIVEDRKKGIYINTNKDLVKVVEKIKKFRDKTHPATKVFQALRIVVNDELNNIEMSLPQALEIVKKGNIVAISFHEGEDRIIKNTFKKWEANGLCKLITKKPITPTQEDIKANPRCRSAKMRVIEK